MELKKIIGQTVHSIRGAGGARGTCIDAKFILFNDGKTFIELEDQDYYTYHDCADYAKAIRVDQDEKVWNIIKKYPVATTDP